MALAQEPDRENARQKIAELEQKLADLPTGKFDSGLHNELRHLYGGIDQKKAMGHVDTILKHQPLDNYMKQVLGGNEADKSKGHRRSDRRRDQISGSAESRRRVLDLGWRPRDRQG